MNENLFYAVITDRGSDEGRDTFPTLKEAAEFAADLTRINDLSAAVVDVDPADLRDLDDPTSFTAYGAKVYARYTDGEPHFGFTPESIADDLLSSDTSFCFEDRTYYWRHNGETYTSKRDMDDFDTDDFDPQDLYDTEVYDPYHSDPFTDCVNDIYEQAQRVEMIRAGLSELLDE